MRIVLSIHFSACGYSLRYLWVPLDDQKKFFNRFYCIFTSFWVTFTLVGRNLKRFPKKSIGHPWVVVGTPKYPQMVEKIFLIVFPAYLHHSYPLLLWSDVIWRGFQKSPFWHPFVVVGTTKYPQIVEKFFLSFFLYISIILSHFYFGRMQFERGFKKVTFMAHFLVFL